MWFFYIMVTVRRKRPDRHRESCAATCLVRIRFELFGEPSVPVQRPFLCAVALEGKQQAGMGSTAIWTLLHSVITMQDEHSHFNCKEYHPLQPHLSGVTVDNCGFACNISANTRRGAES